MAAAASAPLSWALAAERSAAALALGALQPIATDRVLLFDGGMPFVVRRLTSAVGRKQKSAAAAAAGDRNPFLPPDPDLVVAELSATHRVILNKYPVLDNHLLIVTRDFVEQSAWLTHADFVALWQALAACDGLAFYNSGAVAGASQPHRHLQLVALPFAPGLAGVPLDLLVARVAWDAAGYGQIAAWPFAHALARLASETFDDPWRAADVTLAHYRQMLRQTGLADLAGAPQQAAYNLLVTRAWMLLVPRRLPKVHGIALNALGFAGSLFVRGAARWAWLGRHGPQALLAAVAGLPAVA